MKTAHDLVIAAKSRVQEIAIDQAEDAIRDADVLVDVREVHEHQIGNIPYAKLIPLGELPKRVSELNPAEEIVVHCKSGMRSAKACDFLRQSGFTKVKNMKGGILLWSDKVDSSVPKY